MNLKLLKNKNFSLLMAGKAVSLVGSNMQQFALSLYVLAITSSATMFASVIAISTLPRLILSPVAGVFGDWFDRKKIIVMVDLINGLIVGGVAIIFAFYGELTMPIIYVVVIILEITELFFESAMAAVVPSIVEKEDLVHANSFSSLIRNIGGLLSPLLAGVLYGVVGIQIILIINAISFIISGLSEIGIAIPKTHKTPEKVDFKSFKKDFKEGIDIIKKNKILKTLIGQAVVINFVLPSIFSIGLIFVIKNILKGSDLQLGLFNSVLSVSMLIAPILSGVLFKKVKVGKLCVYSFGIVGILILILGIVPLNIFLNMFDDYLIPYICLLVIAFFIGAIITVVNITTSTLFQKIVPLEYMGRTVTTMNFGMSLATPLGQIILGALLDIIPVSIVIGLSGVIILISVILFQKALLSTDKLDYNKEKVQEIKICEQS